MSSQNSGSDTLDENSIRCCISAEDGHNDLCFYSRLFQGRQEQLKARFESGTFENISELCMEAVRMACVRINGTERSGLSERWQEIEGGISETVESERKKEYLVKLSKLFWSVFDEELEQSK